MTAWERFVARRGWWWEAAVVLGLCAAVSCQPAPVEAVGQAHADTPAADTLATDSWEVGEAQQTDEVTAFLEAHYAATQYLRWHSVERWRPVAACESGERWGLNGRYDGALQFSPRTWTAMGGDDFARYAYEAEPWEQVVVADRLVAYEQAQGRGGYGPWPSCARQLGLPR